MSLPVELQDFETVNLENPIPAFNRPFWVSSAAYAVISVAILAFSYRLASGHFVYGIDDTYINMAMAKNFALHGTWGISPYEFSNSSSTPFFVLLLSWIYWLIGPSQYVPLVLSWTFGLASLFVASRILDESLTELWQTIILIAIVLFTPLFVIGTLGMEHSLHLLLTLLFVQRFDRETESPWTIAVIATFMTATRYEGLFMVAAGCLILIAQRRWMRAAIIAVCAVLPVCGYAFYSVSHGGYWLPNSIAIKGVQIHGLSAGGRILHLLRAALSNSVRGVHLFFLLAGLAVIAFAVRQRHPRLTRMLFLVCGAGYLHLVAADVGWAFRYEDYLIAPAVLLAGCTFPKIPEGNQLAHRSAALLFFCSGAFLAGRALQAAVSLPLYSRAIYEQQWQMANFLSIYYPQAQVAANDIGAINYKSDLHCLDLIGLASSDVFTAKREGAYSTQFLDRETRRRGVSIAIIYDSWFSSRSQFLSRGPGIPATWIRVGRWKVPEKQQLGDDTVSFYALNPDEARRLKADLIAFKSALPKGVAATP